MKKILITGPEATGKSQLARELAAAYDCPWVPEYARDFLPRLGRPYEKDDLLTILKGQIMQEYRLGRPDQPYLFCDTGPEVICIWSEVRFGDVDVAIERAVRGQRYDLRLLCYPDLPWTPDPLREAPEEQVRMQLFERYVALHEKYGYEYLVVKGSGTERTATAKQYVEDLT